MQVGGKQQLYHPKCWTRSSETVRNSPFLSLSLSPTSSLLSSLLSHPVSYILLTLIVLRPSIPCKALHDELCVKDPGTGPQHRLPTGRGASGRMYDEIRERDGAQHQLW